MNNNIQTQINKVEKSIIELKEFSNPFSTKFPKTAKLRTLTERMQDLKIPGISIAVIVNNKIDWLKQYGVIDNRTNQEVTQNTIFQAASTSKLITALITLHYVEKKILNLNENINNYLQSWKLPENSEFQNQTVTILDILTHKSGIPTSNFGLDNSGRIPTLVDVLEGRLPAENEPARIKKKPKTSWEYSNLGFVILQLILEDTLKKPFPEIAKDVVFDPLMMKNSTFYYPIPKPIFTAEALPHTKDGVCEDPRLHPTAVAQGGLLTTPYDLALFTSEILLSYNGISEKIIHQNFVRKMLQTQCDIDPDLLGLPVRQGIGVLLFGENDSLVFFHPGSNLPGANCWLFGFPRKEFGAVIMTNGQMGDYFAMEIIKALSIVYLSN